MKAKYIMSLWLILFVASILSAVLFIEYIFLFIIPFGLVSVYISKNSKRLSREVEEDYKERQ